MEQSPDSGATVGNDTLSAHTSTHTLFSSDSILYKSQVVNTAM